MGRVSVGSSEVVGFVVSIQIGGEWYGLPSAAWLGWLAGGGFENSLDMLEKGRIRVLEVVCRPARERVVKRRREERRGIKDGLRVLRFDVAWVGFAICDLRAVRLMM
jgi:hypothetical protein